MKTVVQFRLFVQLFLLFNFLLPFAVFNLSYRDIARFHFLYRILERGGIQQYSASWVDNVLFGYISQTVIYSYIFYMFAYISLYQIIQNLEHSLNLSKPHLVNEQKLISFWNHRMTYVELRERTQKIYGFIAFIFFASLFVVTVAYVLSISLAQVKVSNVIVFFVFYIDFFVVPTFLSSFVLGDYVDFDHRFNIKLYEFLNSIHISNMERNQLKGFNEIQRRAFLNHLRLHLRVPITVSNL